MKREKHKVKVGRKKTRRRWLINPRQRIHSELEYKRSQQRRKAREVIEEELQETKKRGEV